MPCWRAARFLSNATGKHTPVFQLNTETNQKSPTACAYFLQIKKNGMEQLTGKFSDCCPASCALRGKLAQQIVVAIQM